MASRLEHVVKGICCLKSVFINTTSFIFGAFGVN
jgi:hypothetical protein